MVHNKVIKYKCLQPGVRVIQSENPEKQVRGISILRSSIPLILLEKWHNTFLKYPLLFILRLVSQM